MIGDNAFLGFIIGMVFTGGGFYALTNFRLRQCEKNDNEFRTDIKQIKENHLSHIEKDIATINAEIESVKDRIEWIGERMTNHYQTNTKYYMEILENINKYKGGGNV